MAGITTTARDLLADLVAFDTTSHKSNLDIVAYIERYLSQHGVAATRVTSSDGAKASLFATIAPSDHGTQTSGGVALSAHTDVVPVDGQTWTADPFTLRAVGGRLYGRGTSDMKGFIACVLAAVPSYAALAASNRLRRPIHIALSYDEEIGCLGVRPLIAQLGKSLPQPDLIIVGEPTNMRIVDAHKGPVRWRVDITGRAAHSSMAPLGVNAIAIAGKIIHQLESIADELKRSSRNDRFDPPFATLQVTRIAGGTASNIVPVSCHFEFDLRAVPGLSPDQIEAKVQAFVETECLPAMRAVAPEADIQLTRLNAVPPFSAADNPAAVHLALRLLGQNETHAVSYATEAALFQTAGRASVVCGPGDIAQAHTADEWIAESEITRCCEFLQALGQWASGNRD